MSGSRACKSHTPEIRYGIQYDGVFRPGEARKKMKILAIIVFIAMYVLMTVFMSKRLYIVFGAAAILLVTGILPLSSIPGAINWNVLLMIAGTMILVEFFIGSRMPNFMADVLLDKSPTVMWVIILMSLFAGFISAFVDNVATVLMVAPVGIAVCKKLKISPVPMILSIAVSSNLQGAATLVGDTTSIMLGAYANMDFLSFFWMKGRPGIFFAVELGALMTVPVMMILFRKFRQPVSAKEYTKVESYVPTVLIVLMVVLLVSASFIKNKPDVTNGLICCALAAVAMIWDAVRTHKAEGSLRAIKAVDCETLLLLLGLFLVIQGITEAGIIADVADAIASVGGKNMFLLYTIIVWVSVLVSAFVDNIPYVATMLPVIQSITATLGVEPYLLYFGLLTGATLGGNLTPIGASANITATGLLKKEGYQTSFKDFMKIGVPFTLTAVFCGYLFIWFVWH
jgi:Na+/H+ antiporter NhaD/arsenite permease-like protein